MLYDENKPNKALINNFFEIWKGDILGLFMGTIFGYIGFSIIAYEILKKRRIKYLLSFGTKVIATITKV